MTDDGDQASSKGAAEAGPKLRFFLPDDAEEEMSAAAAATNVMSDHRDGALDLSPADAMAAIQRFDLSSFDWAPVNGEEFRVFLSRYATWDVLQSILQLLDEPHDAFMRAWEPGSEWCPVFMRLVAYARHGAVRAYAALVAEEGDAPTDEQCATSPRSRQARADGEPGHGGEYRTGERAMAIQECVESGDGFWDQVDIREEVFFNNLDLDMIVGMAEEAVLSDHEDEMLELSPVEAIAAIRRFDLAGFDWAPTDRQEFRAFLGRYVPESAVRSILRFPTRSLESFLDAWKPGSDWCPIFLTMVGLARQGALRAYALLLLAEEGSMPADEPHAEPPPPERTRTSSKPVHGGATTVH